MVVRPSNSTRKYSSGDGGLSSSAVLEVDVLALLPVAGQLYSSGDGGLLAAAVPDDVVLALLPPVASLTSTSEPRDS